MRRLAAAGAVLTAIIGGALVATGPAFGRYEVHLPDWTPSTDAEVRARGEHLVRHVLACTRCHGEDLGGAVWFDEGPEALGVAPNLTRGAARIAAYRPSDWVRAVRHGISADGAALQHMTASWWSGLADADVEAVVAYLVRLPAVERALPTPRAGWWDRARRLVRGRAFDVVVAREVAADPVPAPDAAYGAYLAVIAGCVGCHEGSTAQVAMSPSAPRPPSLAAVQAGGLTGVAFASAVLGGVGRDGRSLHVAMPSASYAGMEDLEVDALWAWMRSLAPSSPR